MRGMILLHIIMSIILCNKYIQSLDPQNKPNRVLDPYDRLEIKKAVLAKMKKRWDIFNLHNVKFGSDRNFLWPYGVIPYTFEKTFPIKWAMIFENTVDYINNTTCVRYRRRKPQDQDYVEVTHLDTKYYCEIANTGYVRGQTVLRIQSYCIHDRGLILHMMMAIVGFYNQHIQPNRDDYIKIDWDNVYPEMHFYMNKLQPGATTDFGLPYDYHSVMQLYRWVYALNQNKPTMSARIKGVTLGPHNQSFSPDDIVKINTLYEWECAAREYKESIMKEQL